MASMDQRSADSPNRDGQGRHKRRRTRIPLACNACRHRKSRCNGARPRCAMCESLGYECIYESGDAHMKIVAPKDIVSGLAARIADLEAQVSRHEGILTRESRPMTGLPCTPAAREPDSAEDLRADRERADREHAEIALRPAEVQELPPEESLTDGMAVTFVDEKDSSFFGQTSNIALLRHIIRAMVSAGAPEKFNTPRRGEEYFSLDNVFVQASHPASPLSIRAPHRPQGPKNSGMYSLPSESRIRCLVSSYFVNAGVIFPFIHEDSFMETCDTMFEENFTKVRRTWLGLLNMIMAMSSNTMVLQEGTPGQSTADSERFYQNAMDLCGKQILKGTNLETVQYLLLMTQYLQGTQKSVQTWAIHGLAVKAALSLGLHSSKISQKFEPLEQEIRKRVWFTCVLHDRTLSMTFGRPCTIPYDHVRLPFPEPLPTETQRSNRQLLEPLSVCFYCSTIKLYNIMTEVITSLYGSNLGCDSAPSGMDLLTRVFQIQPKLEEWESALPPELSPCTASSLPLNDSNERHLLERFRVVLSLRKLNLDVLLHRTVLVSSMDQNGRGLGEVKSSKMIDSMSASSIEVCVRSSETIISLVHTIITSATQARTMLGAWWYTLYYTFNAALVLFSTMFICPEHWPFEQALEPRLERCKNWLRKAHDCLQQLNDGDDNRIIIGCADYLVKLQQFLTSWPIYTGEDHRCIHGSSGWDSTESANTNLPLPLETQASDFGNGFSTIFDPSLGAETSLDFFSGDPGMGQFYLSFNR